MKNLIYRIFQNSGLLIVSLGLLFGGVSILNTSVPFWSLVYGLPAVSLGIVLSLITFNEISTNKTAKSNEYHLIPCKVCHSETLAPMLVNSLVCTNCQYKMAIKLNIGALVFFILIGIPLTFNLTQKQQDIRQRANEYFPSSSECSPDIWEPEICQCGNFSGGQNCNHSELERKCRSSTYCCQISKKNEWNCRLIKKPKQYPQSK